MYVFRREEREEQSLDFAIAVTDLTSLYNLARIAKCSHTVIHE